VFQANRPGRLFLRERKSEHLRRKKHPASAIETGNNPFLKVHNLNKVSLIQYPLEKEPSNPMNKFYTLAKAICNHFIMLLFLLLLGTVTLAQPRNGYSYVNITKQTVGGTVEPGDILEIRHSVHIKWGYNGGTVYKMRYYDSLPTNTAMLTSPAGALRVITNEGVTVKSYTTGQDTDAGTYLANPPAGEYPIRINLGKNATAPVNNRLTNEVGAGSLNVSSQAAGDRPKWYSGHLFSTAFRVVVTGNYGDTIKLGAAKFYYSTSAALPAVAIQVYRFSIIISKNDALCANIVGANFAGENGGTFGSGNTLVRSTPAESPILGYRPIINSDLPGQPVDDGMYSIMKNTSPISSTNINANRELNCNAAPVNASTNCNNRMFGSWDINGDHTGSNNATGNAPVAANTPGGYMLVVNSDYVTNEAFQQSISGLCPNTTYEFSAWIRNVCKDCHWDSTLSRSAGDGVRPNLTWVLDGVDRYSTGEIPYTGTWVKKGFTFTTGPTQNTAIFSIRNNAQGGGGNDWVMDDISIATCQPNLIMKPYGNAVVCYGNQVDFSADVQSYFNNYNNWRWERSFDGGITWQNQTSGVGNPVLTGGQYLYTIDYPVFIGDSTSNGDVIRLRIATTPGNLDDDNCSFLANTQVIVLVNNCQWVLSADIIQFKAQQVSSGVSLRWASVNETAGLTYVIEKSSDMRSWKKIIQTPAKVSGGNNNYSELDPGTVYQTTYYRISMIFQDKNKYTHQVTVQPTGNDPSQLALKSLQNPFANQLPFELMAPEAGEARITLYDLYGKPQRQMIWKVQKGNNRLSLNETNGLAAGTYILMATLNEQVTQKKVIKMNQK
jgi:hypothetical protein